MQSINVVTINAECEQEQDLVKIVEDARNYFPSATWDNVLHNGKHRLKHDIKVTTKGESFEAFLFKNLAEKLGKISKPHRPMSLLLAITPNPVVAMYCYFDGKRFKRSLYLVHDYVNETFGVVSLFHVKERSSSKVIAHGLGHGKGLNHHLEPADLMHPELLRTSTLQVEGFCKACLQKLTINQKHQ
ncbi:MAG: hypothetical protein PVF15_09845 [Candidatus Bathyarchaeota archaeon]|jgi:hypothetical protein